MRLRLRFLLLPLAAALLATAAPAVAAQATVSKASLIASNYQGNIGFGRLGTTRIANPLATNGVSGVSYVTLNRVTINYSDALSPALQVQKTTLHEMTHMVEYRTTPAMRVALYRYLGVSTSGAYTAIPTVSGANLLAWKASARERLAESVVNCQYGAGSFIGMVLVPRAQCGAFAATLVQAIAVSR